MDEQRAAGSRAARRTTMLAGLALGALPLGCAHLGGRHADPRGGTTPVALAPPAAAGATVRSQDARRLGRRNPRAADPVVTSPTARAGETEIAWSGPRRESSPTQPPQVRPLPEPPVLPAEIAAPAPVLSEPASPLAAGRPEARGPEPLSASTIEEPTIVQTPAALEPPAEVGVAAIRRLVETSRERIAPVRSYQARMIRQEKVGETLLPEEELILSVRREPFAVRLEWPAGSANQGREVLYSAAETGGKMQIRQPGSLVPRLTLAPDSPLVRKNSRHPITEAGFDELLKNLEASARGVEVGAIRSRMTMDGPVDLPEVGRRCHRITEIRENGETWVVGLDAESLMPVYVRGTDATGGLLEQYRFLEVRTDLAELAAAGAFDPEARWGGGGLLGRLARGEGGAEGDRTSR